MLKAFIYSENGNAIAELSDRSAWKLAKEANGYFDDGIGNNRRFIFMSDVMWGYENLNVIIRKGYYMKF